MRACHYLRLAAWIGTAIFPSPILAIQGSCVINDLYGDIQFLNCGVSSALIVTSLLSGNDHILLDNLQTQSGSNWENPLSFTDLTQALSKAGLHSKALKKTSPEEAYAFAQNGAKIIVHIWAGRDLGHFIVLSATPSGQIAIYDPPRKVRLAWKQEIMEMLGQRMTGNVLVVNTNTNAHLLKESAQVSAKKPGHTVVSTPIVLNGIDEKDRSIKSAIEDVHQGDNLIVPKRVFVAHDEKAPTDLLALVTVRNTSSKPITITDVKGSCGCFKGFTGDNIASPNSTMELHLRFDAGTFSLDQGTSVAILTTDLALPAAVIDIAFNSKAQFFRVTPEFLNTGKIKRSLLAEHHFHAYILCDATSTNYNHDLVVTSDNSAINVTAKSPSEVAIANHRYLMWPVDISIEPSCKSSYLESVITARFRDQPEYVGSMRIASRIIE